MRDIPAPPKAGCQQWQGRARHYLESKIVMHKFRIGQVLDLLPSHGSSTRRAGECEIIALLPFEGHVVQYKVQSRTETYLRIVSESDLRPLQ